MYRILKEKIPYRARAFYPLPYPLYVRASPVSLTLEGIQGIRASYPFP